MASVPSHSEVVIIGGGIAGCSIAYHLAEKNIQVTLVERKSLTCGTTWHAAGLVGQLRATKNLTKMAKYSTELYRKLNERDKNWTKKKIKARFICALTISYLNKTLVSVVGKVEGKISSTPKGKNGFGYDPIFIPNRKKKTFGEIKSYQKYKIDHRFKAFKKIKKFL